ncbi:MAG: hypothetical protein GWM92_03270, partial [Gemmatimonadetes bacterium]|nr:hypothetical protein [Gemmatimonadota bacterium]NIR79039.1 hypothetical protein [Gemmatimonadota bacterium]NIT86056.1 hypothetical protein [Gemmatimonadota bacterium]NIU31557.1 hypothetical protein [Gemmatimonadota bacterium]NIU36213.1 hypothetical protein [Gemmatimonadota bacterium]
RRAIENFTLAVERDSGYALAYSGLADALTLGWFYGFEVGDEPLERGLERDPLSPAVHSSAALAYVALDDVAAAERHWRRAVDLEPGYGLGWLSVGRILAASGSPEDGIPAAERGRRTLTERGDSIWGGLASLATVQALAGRPDSARVLLERARRSGTAPFWIGLAYAAMGERDPAFAWLGRSRWERTVPIRFRYHPVLDPLRSDPRFDDLLARLERAWGLTAPASPPA